MIQDMTSNPHYFIGLPIPTDIKEQLVEWQSDLRKYLPYKQWTNMEDFHITLKFLGAVELETVIKLRDELRVIEGTAPFSAQLNGVDTFGSPTSPRVLFANVLIPESLKRLVDVVDQSTEKYGFEKEKRAFRAHVTLAKKWLPQAPKMNVESVTSKYQQENQPFIVDRVNLFQIYPTKNPKYEVVESFTLKEMNTGGTAH